uniref:Uncharacterized protein n=1 Tax=Plectus sambesii TaxID=2011161 RepID=A0A914UQD3_9BILA
MLPVYQQPKYYQQYQAQSQQAATNPSMVSGDVGRRVGSNRAANRPFSRGACHSRSRRDRRRRRRERSERMATDYSASGSRKSPSPRRKMATTAARGRFA